MNCTIYFRHIIYSDFVLSEIIWPFGVWLWRCSVLSQHSCSEPPDRFQVRQGSPCQHGIRWSAASVCPPGVSVASCCFISLSTPHCLSVKSSFALRLLAVNCAFYLFSTPPQTSLTFLCSFPSLFVSSSSCFSFLSPVLTWHHLFHLTPSLFHPGLCCGVVLRRSEQDRWSQMISGLCSFLRETAWYCC